MLTVPEPSGSILNQAAIPTDPIWRFSVEQYHAMIQGSILTDDDPVELLEGWLVPKMPKNPPHRVATRLVREALEQVLPEGWYVDSQEPITLLDSEPEPDVIVVRGNTRQYLDRHPGPQDLALVIEVADTTLQRDRTLKKRTYARAGIPVYWIINLPERQIEVHTMPMQSLQEPDYKQRTDYGQVASIPVEIAGTEVTTLSIPALLP
jgi:Uma2 family endonuclease